jgi:excisionase family DNA binding protein
MTVKDAAQYAAVSPDTIYSACLLNELQHARVGGRRCIRLKAEHVDKWLNRYGCEGQESPSSVWTTAPDEEGEP